MWLLESTGEFLEGKRVWLRPGQRYLFGRVKKDGVYRALDHKGVSRRQCIIEVGTVESGHASLLHTRSTITVTDEKSKAGTQVDGQVLKGNSKELTGSEHHLKLGAYPHVLVIKWVTICLSFFLTSKEKKGPNPLGAKRASLEPLDIKAVQPFVSNETTHVVAAKRNTVPGLQALIKGRYIVDHSYVDALVFATTPEDLEGDENLSPLEKDFDAAWPDPWQHLPPSGREPTKKPAEAYMPNATREYVFDGWTFIFLELGQYETILPAITTGHGKALLYSLKLGTTVVEDIVAFVQNTAGEKATSKPDQSMQIENIIIVKPTLKGDFAGWCDQLVKDLASSLNQQIIDQADFLDAILSCDASTLKKPLEFKNAQPTAIGSTNSAQSVPAEAQVEARPKDGAEQDQATSNSDAKGPSERIKRERPQPEHEPPPKRPRRRAVPPKRFQNFDDEFERYTVAPEELAEEHDNSQNPLSSSPETDRTPRGSEEIHSNGRNMFSEEFDAPASGDSAPEDFLPATKAMSKRRPAIDREVVKQEDASASNHPNQATGTGKPNATTPRSLDIRQATRERRRAEDEAARQQQERLEGQADDVPIEKLRNLAVIEEMKVPNRANRSDARDRDLGTGWEERWNGRKNFKKFQRKGQGSRASRGLSCRTIVPVVEVRRKNYGIGDSYWSSSSINNRQGQEDNSANGTERCEIAPSPAQSHDQAQVRENTEGSNHRPIVTRLQQEAANIIDPSGEAPPSTRESTSTSRTEQATQSTVNHCGSSKRPASSLGRGVVGTAKRQKTIPITHADSESESDEDLRFKFSRSRR